MTPRNSTGIRGRIVAAAQQAFHERGYHGSPIEDVLARAGATKGGLYHHFPDKESLARAVIREALRGWVERTWVSTHWHQDPIGYLEHFLATMPASAVAQGCPLNSLAQEVAFAHPGLRPDIAELFDLWIAGIAAGLRAGIERGIVRGDVDPDQVATFVLASFEGLVGLAKANQRGQPWIDFGAGPLVTYLRSLRAGPRT